jgi:cell division protein FtsL
VSALKKFIPNSPEIREPLLRLVDKATIPSESRRRLIVTLSVGAVVIALFAVALIQARLVQTQRDVDALYAEIESMEAERAQLANEVVHAESPEGIIARAIELGMVSAQEPVHLEAVRSPVASDSADGTELSAKRSEIDLDDGETK